MNTKDTQKYIEVNRSALFDWVVFTSSILMGFIFPTSYSMFTFSFFSYLILVALIFYIVGACIKKLPLNIRLRSAGHKPSEIPFLFFLLVGHWVIFLGVFIISESAVNNILGLPPPKTGESGGWYIFLSIVISVAITWVVFSSSKRKKLVPNTRSANYLFRRELIADILLSLGVSVLTFAFWEKGIMTMFIGRVPGSVSEMVSLFLLLFFSFVLFYLPLRYLFLIEDHSTNQTWRRMFLIMGMLLLRSLFAFLGL